MFGDDSGDRSNTSLRGWLSEVYFSALLEGAIEPLAGRLGGRATVDDPLFGRASGGPAVVRQLGQTAEWLKTSAAKLTRHGLVMGVDRDVAEGTLGVTLEGRTLDLPVTVVAERRRGREVELRVYYAAELVTGKRAERAALAPAAKGIVLPEQVRRHLDALGRGDVDGAVAAFEKDGMLREATGRTHVTAGGDLRRHLERYATGGFEVDLCGQADDGRTCALEVSLVKLGGKPLARTPALFVYERGDDGGLRSLRIYDDVDVG